MYTNRFLAISIAVLAAVAMSWWIVHQEKDMRAVEKPSPEGDQWWAHAPTEPSKPLNSSSANPEISPRRTDESALGAVPADATSMTIDLSDWEAAVNAARTDRNAARTLDYVAILCQTLTDSRAKSNRFNDARWTAVARRCPSDLPDAMTRLTTSAPPDSPAIRQLRQAVESGDAAKRDEVAKSLLQSSNDPDELESAINVYFDSERLRALAGDDRPNSLAGSEGPLSLQIDLSLLVSCSLATDCAARTPITLTQCVTTSLCYPGQSMQQIIAMRRSPEEMAYLERLLKYVHEMRTTSR